MRITSEHIGKRVRRKDCEGIVTSISDDGKLMSLKGEQCSNVPYFYFTDNSFGDWHLVEDKNMKKDLPVGYRGWITADHLGKWVKYGSIGPIRVESINLGATGILCFQSPQLRDRNGELAWEIVEDPSKTKIEDRLGIDYKRFGCNEPYVRELVQKILAEIDKKKDK